MTQQDMTWINEEVEQIGERKTYEKKPALKLEENKPVTVEVDLSVKPEKYTTDDRKGGKVTKVIIPVKVNGESFVWWLNVKNPIWKELLDAAKKGIFVHKIMQTGSAQNTKYIILK